MHTMRKGTATPNGTTARGNEHEDSWSTGSSTYTLRISRSNCCQDDYFSTAVYFLEIEKILLSGSLTAQREGVGDMERGSIM